MNELEQLKAQVKEWQRDVEPKFASFYFRGQYHAFQSVLRAIEHLEKAQKEEQTNG
jgi:uncharacterized protein YecE (DUF72 family)